MTLPKPAFYSLLLLLCGLAGCQRPPRPADYVVPAEPLLTGTWLMSMGQEVEVMEIKDTGSLFTGTHAKDFTGAGHTASLLGVRVGPRLFFFYSHPGEGTSHPVEYRAEGTWDRGEEMQGTVTVTIPPEIVGPEPNRETKMPWTARRKKP